MTKTASPDCLDPKELYKLLVHNGVNYFCGVPDSLLSPFCFYLEDHSKGTHDIAVNEGSAIALAAGHYLATSKVPLVYMQNSGLGNAINPLVSLADPLVMGIPMILLVGFRGRHGKNDEPQHLKQGLITGGLLDTLGIPYVILSRQADRASKQVRDAVRNTAQSKRPFALLVESGTLGKYNHIAGLATDYPLSREEAISLVIDSLSGEDAVVATTGKTSRELFEYRENRAQSHKKDLLIVGGMGYASSVAMAIAQQKPGRRVYCLDGDGAVLMHMGSLAAIGSKGLKNFYHIVINNGSHDSVGGQPTVGFDIDMPAIAKASGYRHCYSVHKLDALDDTLQAVKKLSGPVFIEIRVNKNSRPDLKRPAVHPSKNKDAFMSFLNES